MQVKHDRVADCLLDFSRIYSLSWELKVWEGNLNESNGRQSVTVALYLEHFFGCRWGFVLFVMGFLPTGHLRRS